MSSVKRKCFTIEEKRAILHRLEAGESNATLAKEFGVSHSTISTIKKSKDKIEPLFNANVLKCKRVRTSTYEQVDKALLQWFKFQRDRGIPVNGPLLQEKANFFARQLDIQDFKCAMSWINRFKVRHNIVSGKIAGESLSVQQSDLTITNEDFEQFTCVDDAVATCEEPCDENIVENIIARDANSQESDGDDDEQEEVHPTLSVSDALKAAETLNVFVQTKFDDDIMKTMMSRIHNAVRSSYYRTKVCQKQTQITDFLR
ncbi:hypothetical protein SFRURICE_006558 [Spodoptera frugiperda]|nr:hypothetical protein SFRURICE_006558 [Spodoptera frugiperda]